MSSYARRLLLSRWRAVCTRSLSDIRVWCNVLWVVGEAERRRRGIKNTGIGGCGGKKRERELTGKKEMYREMVIFQNFWGEFTSDKRHHGDDSDPPPSRVSRDRRAHLDLNCLSTVKQSTD